jgi:hypothetical protein
MNVGDKVLILCRHKDFSCYLGKTGTLTGIEPERGTPYIYKIGDIAGHHQDVILLAENEFEVCNV